MNYEYRDLIAFDGTMIKCLIRETGNRNWLIVTHGLGEHMRRHEYLLSLFSAHFNIVLYDLRGHGKSGGQPAWIEDFSHYLKDLDMIIQYLKKQFNLQHYILMGHSMGGLITSSYLQKIVKEDSYPEKVFLSSPATAGAGFLGNLFNIAPQLIFDGLLSLPSIPLKGMLDLKGLSHDSRVYESYVSDDLNHLKIHSRLFFEILKEAKKTFSKPLNIKCPLYVAIGSEDRLVNPQSVIDYFKNIESNGILEVFEGAYHELHNEIEKYKLPYLKFLRHSLTGLEFSQ